MAYTNTDNHIAISQRFIPTANDLVSCQFAMLLCTLLAYLTDLLQRWVLKDPVKEISQELTSIHLNPRPYRTGGRPLNHFLTTVMGF
jgi:hypothetical protein